MEIYDGPGLSPLSPPSAAVFELRRMATSSITVHVPKELHERVTTVLNSLDHALQAPSVQQPRRYFQPRRRMQATSLRSWLAKRPVVD
jgi:hypothetical protein